MARRQGPDRTQCRPSSVAYRRLVFRLPYDRAALLSIDGSGSGPRPDGRNGWQALHLLQRDRVSQLAGVLYEAATQFCGFRPNYDEGKTMGLAPFGDPERFYGTMAQMIEIGPRGEVKMDLSWFNYQTLAHWRLGDRYVQVSAGLAGWRADRNTTRTSRRPPSGYWKTACWRCAGSWNGNPRRTTRSYRVGLHSTV
ncbi:MAG: hypothetical protein H6986_13320 [Pseudomonadales bacterium]|nr:hypothetical protein [Pseudomonadales bacterium]